MSAVAGFPHQIVVELKKSSQKPPNLVISSFGKATYNYFNYFGPWTAFVQGPPLNLSPMKVPIASFSGRRPVRERTFRRARPLAVPSPIAGCHPARAPSPGDTVTAWR